MRKVVKYYLWQQKWDVVPENWLSMQEQKWPALLTTRIGHAVVRLGQATAPKSLNLPILAIHSTFQLLVTWLWFASLILLVLSTPIAVLSYPLPSTFWCHWLCLDPNSGCDATQTIHIKPPVSAVLSPFASPNHLLALCSFQSNFHLVSPWH